MRTVPLWTDKPPERDDIRNICYDTAARPDGTQLVAGVGNRVLIYDTADGSLLHTLKGHKDAIYAVAYDPDGKRFATGSADKTVIVWSATAEGLLKYSHGDAIQALAFNPATHQLASCTATDFGLWSPEEKSVTKHKVNSKLLCASWTPDGQFLALGTADGCILLRNKLGGEERVIAHRDPSLSLPIWTCAWSPQPGPDDAPVLAVGCWDGTLSFYSLLTGQPVYKTRDLGYDATRIAYNATGDLMYISGSNRAVTLYTKEGMKLASLIEHPSSWIWSTCPLGSSNNVALGTEDGTVAVHSVVFNTVHGLYRERYAYRENLTDVIVQHLMSEAKVRIHCRDHVKRIAIYKDKLAVQLSERIVIYELQNKEDPNDMHYRIAVKISKKLECSLLVLTSNHLILCQEKKCLLYSLQGELVREWQLDATVRYIKTLGGAASREALLVGLKSGAVVKLFVDSPFPVHLLTHSAAIRCLDMSLDKNKLALVDDLSKCCVYDLTSKSMTFSAPDVNSVAWNSEFDDMLCYTGNQTLSIKTASFPVHAQKMQGVVVGFRGSKVFCLRFVSMVTIDVPQTASMIRYLEQKEFDQAFRVARLGVTESDWRVLGREALLALNLDVAQKCYTRIKDVRMIQRMTKIMTTPRGRNGEDEALRAEVRASLGQYREAAELYRKMGRLDLAMGLFMDLRQFEEAKRWAEELQRQQGESELVKDLMMRQAEWFEDMGDARAAAELYRTGKRYDRAILLLGKHEKWDELMDLTRTMTAKDARVLSMAGEAFRSAGRMSEAREMYEKAGDFKLVASLLVESNQWEDALQLMNAHPNLRSVVMLPYAEWLAMQDRFDEARWAYKVAGRSEDSVAVLEQLAHNAVLEDRFADAAFYLYHLAMEALSALSAPIPSLSMDSINDVAMMSSPMSEADQEHLKTFHELYHRAEIYYGYDFIHRYVIDPFSRTDKHTLFNVSRHLMMRLLHRNDVSGSDAPLGISMARIVHTLAQVASEVKAYKMSRTAYQRLQTLKLPPAWQETVDLACVKVRTQKTTDDASLLPVCFRCGAPNPLLNPTGDACVSCQAPFIRSYLTFEIMPLVEFALEPDISDEEAQALLEQEPPHDNPLKRAALVASQRRKDVHEGYARELKAEGAEMLRLEEDDDGIVAADLAVAMADPFVAQRSAKRIIVGRETLVYLSRSEVLIRSWPSRCVRPQYYRIMDHDAPLCLGPDGHCYEHDEYELASFEKSWTPFSRTPIQMDAEVTQMDAHYSKEGEPVHLERLPMGKAAAALASVAEKRQVGGILPTITDEETSGAALGGGGDLGQWRDMVHAKPGRVEGRRGV